MAPNLPKLTKAGRVYIIKFPARRNHKFVLDKGVVSFKEAPYRVKARTTYFKLPMPVDPKFEPRASEVSVAQPSRAHLPLAVHQAPTKC